jgi:LacI family transcriptional regulator
LFGMPPRAPSISTLARELGLARTTVSDALRGHGRVSAATVKRVRAAAAAAGYKSNPLLATVLGAINHSRRSPVRGALAIIDLYEQAHWPHGPFQRELVAGAKARAAEMGFAVAEFVVGDARLPWSRLESILRSRAIHGVIVLPAWFEPDLSPLDWSRYAGLYMDHASRGPELHSVCSDHYGSMLSLLELLEQRGYRRPGLILQRGRDARLRGRQSAAFRAFHAARGSATEAVPPLITEEYPRRDGDFAPWFRQHRPDVVLSHFPETRDWIRSADPFAECGVVLLNILHGTYPCAGLDLQPRILGARAAEMVVGQILRNEFGVPAWASRTTVQARWVEGPTVRPSPRVAAADLAPAGAGPARPALTPAQTASPPGGVA